jgi:uncharacterized caspase-like protein
MRFAIDRREWLNLHARRGTAAALTLWMGAHASAQQAGVPRADRRALLIGNAAYAKAPLRNPVRDARLMASTLRQLGFSTTAIEDATLPRMVDAIRDWVASSRDARSRFFYFAGHAVQLNGRNYLLPVDAVLRSEQEIPQRGLNVTDLTERMSAIPTGVNVFVLDACRNQPYPIESVAGARSLGATEPGLGSAFPPTGTLVAFSTAPGAVAQDGQEGGHSVYTRHLSQVMLQPGMTLESVFKRVRTAVARETKNQQVPWDTSSLVGDYCLTPDANGICGGSSLRSGPVDLAALRR